MCLHRIPKGDSWVHLLSQIRRQEVNGRKVELDEVIVPSLELESSSSLKSVPVMPTPISEEVNDDDHKISHQVTTEPRR